MKNYIKIFKSKDVKIKSLIKLKEYINFCLENNISFIKNKTSKHHILPRKLFPEFSDLNLNEWNGVNLSHYNHYYAHYLLTEAIDDYKMLYAFCAMHNKDKKLERITEDELINAEEFQLKMEERSVKHKEHLSTITDNGKSIATNAALKSIIKKNEVIIIDGKETTTLKEATKKRIVNMKLEFFKNGEITTSFIESSKKYSNTMTKEFIDENGIITSKAKERSKKYSNTMTKEFIDENGIITSKAKERGKKISDKIKINGTAKGCNNSMAKRIAIYDSQDNLIAISHGNFVQTCKSLNLPDNLLGISYRTGNTIFSSNFGKTIAMKTNREHLIGFYAKELKEELDIISNYGFEPKDVMGKVQEKAKKYFYEVENSSLN